MVGFCPHCGSLMRPRESICSACGRNINDDPLDDDIAPIMPKNLTDPKTVEQEDPDLPFFPYEPRPVQVSIVRDIVEAFDNGKHIVVESGTGTGKTIVSLAAALDHASRNHKKVVYLTRTISQSDQVMKELRAISKLRPVCGITITGRGRSCPYLRTLSGYEDMHPSVLASLCEEGKKKYNDGQGGCRYYGGSMGRLKDTEAYVKASHPTSEELDRFCEDRGICPYEVRKMIMKDMDVVVAPYVHFLSDDIRDGFLGNLESDGTDIVMIIDEAHNMIVAAREQESFTIPMTLVEGALDESTTMRGDPPLFENVTLRPFLNELKNSIRSFANDHLSLNEKESILGPTELEDRIMKRFELSKRELDIAIRTLISLGEERTDMLMEKGENRISDLYTLGDLLKDWMLSASDRYIKSINVNDKEESLHAACIDPCDVTRFVREIPGVLHMSGTLQPLDQYVKVMGLSKDCYQRIYPSPFPKENRSVIYLGNVTTRYEDMKRDPSIFSRMEKNIARLCNNVDKNTLVFFPSYSMMNKMMPFLERDVHKDLYWEVSGQQKRTMKALYDFRKGRNGVFFTVMGGSIAEGIDFPGEELCFAIIVGIPYPPPTLESKAMSKLFDEKYGPGTGWRYTSEVPALRKMQQAIGRLIRTETDRGMAVIFDSRASKYASRLGAKLSNDPLQDVTNFFSKTQ